jgi:hypothetical protein
MAARENIPYTRGFGVEIRWDSHTRLKLKPALKMMKGRRTMKNIF